MRGALVGREQLMTRDGFDRVASMPTRRASNRIARYRTRENLVRAALPRLVVISESRESSPDFNLDYRRAADFVYSRTRSLSLSLSLSSFVPFSRGRILFLNPPTNTCFLSSGTSARENPDFICRNKIRNA